MTRNKTVRTITLSAVASQLALLLFVIWTTLRSGALNWRYLFTLSMTAFIYWGVLKSFSHKPVLDATDQQLKVPFLLVPTFMTICIIWYDHLIRGVDRWEAHMGALTLPGVITLLMEIKIWYKKLRNPIVNL